MEFIYQQLLERNSRETTPFVSIYESYTSLLNLTDTLQTKCSIAEREVERLQQQVHDPSNSDGSTSNTISTASSSLAIKSAMRNETRLREQLEGLQEEYNLKVKELLKLDSLLQEAQSLNATQEKSIEDLTQQLDREKKSSNHLKSQLEEIEVNSKLLEEQNDKLKVTIRSLQHENDKLKKENLMFEGRLVAEKGKVVDEMNELTDMVERLKAEVDLLRRQGMERKGTELNYSSWFGSTSNGGLTKKVTDNASPDRGKAVKNQADGMASLAVDTTDTDIVPNAVIHSIKAHAMEGTCVRYDHTGTSNFVATASSDSTVRVWDSISGQQHSIFRGTPGYSIVCCDLAGTLVVGGGSDKSCRVWDVRNERMIHQLVGHENKITCVRLFGGNKPAVITGSIDHTLRLWDISRKTYRQEITLRHNSTSTCVDVASDSTTVVSGHMDGGLRFWDLRSGERTADASVTHEGGTSSVQFKPTDNTQVLTSSMDSSLKIIDVRTMKAIHTFIHSEQLTSGQNWSRSTFSPDGRYVATCSSSTAIVYVWDTLDRSIKGRLNCGNTAGIISIDWYRNKSSNEPHVGTLDRKGILVLWGNKE